MNETLAMMMTIIFCNNNVPVRNNTCEDGSVAQQREIKLLSTNGNVVEIKANNNIMFQLRFDGSIFADINFKADPEAILFWRALGNHLGDVCATLPAIQEKN